MSDYGDRLASLSSAVPALRAFADGPDGEKVVTSFPRCLVWIGLLYHQRPGRPEGVVLAAAHSKVIEIWALVPLGLMHAAYSSLRTVIDLVTSFTYYDSHPIEWAAVAEGRAQWEGRGQIMDWHLEFTRCFKALNKHFPVNQRLNDLYRQLSMYVHGLPAAGLPSLLTLEFHPPSTEETRRFLDLSADVDEALSLLLLGVFHSELPNLPASEYRTVRRGIDLAALAEAGILLPSSGGA